MSQQSLFDLGEFEVPAADEVAAAGEDAAESGAGGKPRLRIAQRNQVEMRYASWDQLLPADDEARMVWSAVCGLDLSRWLGDIKAVEGVRGRNKTDPRLLLALWIYATLRGEPSAREMERLCETCLPYQWLCGGVTVNHHMLSDFRSQSGESWKDLLSQIVGVLLAEELVTLDCVAQDGMRVRASAGTSSFRRRATLEKCLQAAQEQVEALDQLAANATELTRRRQQAQQRAARERQARVEQALQHCETLQADRDERSKTTNKKPNEARASTTDPEARTMKFANGGYNPGYNVQFMTDTGSGIVVGVEVTSVGSDAEELSPMLDQVSDRCQRPPQRAVVDGGYSTKESIIEAQEKHGCIVYAPLKDEKKQLLEGENPYAPKKGDQPAVKAWRARMGEAASKAIYKLRGQTAEWVNARCRNHGLQQMPVRSQAKCLIVALLHALTHNIQQAVRLYARKATMPG